MLTQLLSTCFKKVEQYIISGHVNTNIHMLVQASTRRSKLCQSWINLLLSAVRQDFSCPLTFNPDIRFHGEYGVPVCVCVCSPLGSFCSARCLNLFFSFSGKWQQAPGKFHMKLFASHFLENVCLNLHDAGIQRNETKQRVCGREWSIYIGMLYSGHRTGHWWASCYPLLVAHTQRVLLILVGPASSRSRNTTSISGWILTSVFLFEERLKEYRWLLLPEVYCAKMVATVLLSQRGH